MANALTIFHKGMVQHLGSSVFLDDIVFLPFHWYLTGNSKLADIVKSNVDRSHGNHALFLCYQLSTRFVDCAIPFP